MTNTFCTIITAGYYPKALTLYKSLQQFDASVQLQVLVTDNKAVSSTLPQPAGIKLIAVSDLSGYSLVNDLYNKYAHLDPDFFRWSLKPVFISYLLENGFDKVLYIDCDMFFFNDYHFLFSELDNSSVLLTPNWINSDPLVDKDSFFSLFTSGFFSAGFIGANKKGLPALTWWAAACHFMMGEHIQAGIRDDQKYLDIFPLKFAGTKILQHRGCNIGAWNYDECKRELINGKVLINGEFPVIFIHFDGMMVQGILRGYDKLLLPHLEQYQKTFEETGNRLADFIAEVDTHAEVSIVTKIKWRLKFKSRIKKFLYKASRKL
jgi:hypothetical protein